jgi:hypothetical protein
MRLTMGTGASVAVSTSVGVVVYMNPWACVGRRQQQLCSTQDLPKERINQTAVAVVVAETTMPHATRASGRAGDVVRMLWKRHEKNESK